MRKKKASVGASNEIVIMDRYRRVCVPCSLFSGMGVQNAFIGVSAMMDTSEMIAHIEWTIDKSPKAYVELRDGLIDLRIALVNAELRYQETKGEENGIDR